MSTVSLNSFYDQIVLIDDDPVHNMIAKKVLIKFVNVTVVKIIPFQNPKEGLNYLLNQNPEQALKTLVFLDINMSVLSGWDVLDRLIKLDEKIKENMKLYMLTSSINPMDEVRAASYPLVKGFLSKPLLPHLKSIFT
jgi:two-component system chemotaxis response regulator CheY